MNTLLFIVVCTLFAATFAAPVPSQINGTNVNVNLVGLIGQTSYTAGGNGNSTLFNPYGLAVNSRGGVYVTDSGLLRILYYPTPQSQNPQPSLVLGGYLNGTIGEITRQIGSISVYSGSTANSDAYVAVTSNTVLLLVFQNVNDSVNSAPQAVAGFSGQGILNHFAGPNGRLYVADPTGNRVVIYSNNITAQSLPIDGYGTGNSTTYSASSCDASSQTCLTYPTAVGVDCGGNVWVAAAYNGSIFNPFVLYFFPVGSKTATYAFSTGGANWARITDISFSSTCNRMAISAVNSLYVVNYSYNPTLGPTLGNPTIYGRSDGVTVTPADQTSNSLGNIYSADFISDTVIALVDNFHNRVVLIDTTSTPIQPSGTPTAGVTSPSAAAASGSPSASNNTVLSTSASRSANASSVASPSASNNTVLSTSASRSANATANASSPFIIIPSQSGTPSRSANSSSVAGSASRNATAPSGNVSPSNFTVIIASPSTNAGNSPSGSSFTTFNASSVATQNPAASQTATQTYSPLNTTATASYTYSFSNSPPSSTTGSPASTMFSWLKWF